MQKLEFKNFDTVSELEISGVNSFFNKAFKSEFKKNLNEDFFICGGLFCSTSMANGKPILIEGLKLSYLRILKNGVLIAVCEDDNEKETFFKIGLNYIVKLS
jgi:hypothetical protein